MTDTFRKEQKTLDENTLLLITRVKGHAEKLEELLQSVKSREMSLALTNLEQAVMWATKAIVLNSEKPEPPTPPGLRNVGVFA